MPAAPRRLAPLAALAGLLLACATTVNPVTGERETLVLSPAQEAAAGRQASAQVEQQMGLVADPALQAYVRELGARLARLSPRQDVAYSFAVVDMPEPNAFALPGGYIYVSRGLLALVNSEDELANVLAHEIGHVAALHHAQRQTRATGVGLATVLGTLAAGALGGEGAAQAVGQIGQVAGAGLIASYSRDQERQSDEVGQSIAARAGYDPLGMTHFLETLGREARLRAGGPQPASFLDSHPSTPERVATTRARAAQLTPGPPSPIAGSRGAFLVRLEGLPLGPDPAEGVLRDGIFLHPTLDLHVGFPAGWRATNAREAVTAAHPQDVAALSLTSQGPGRDPRAAAEAFAARVQLPFGPARELRIGGLPALAAAADLGGGRRAELTWIAYRGQIYRFEAVWASRYESQLLATLRGSVESFRPLTTRERESIRVRRLAVVTARGGETAADLARRTGSAWSPEETALANGLAPGERLAAGFPVKIALESPWTGGPGGR